MPNFQTLKGFRDIMPQDAKKRQWLKAKMIDVAESWGYQPIETPTLEPLELFVGEIGEDEKLFYKFTDAGGRNVALRYDQTVPTCRFIGNHVSEITLPFRRYQIQNVFRSEKPQKGRYREFTQFDVDIFGISSPVADAEIIAENLNTLKAIGFKQATAIINSRELMKGIPYEAIVAIDKLKKIGSEGVISNMIAKGITAEKAKEYFSYVQNIQPDETINIVISYLKNSGFDESWYRFEPTLARSFSYSQGPIWELTIPEYSTGSVGGGERYDGMLKRLTGQSIPATGIAFGFERTLEAAEACNLIPTLNMYAQVLITVMDEKLFPTYLNLGSKLRSAEISTEVFPSLSVKLDKQLKYANNKNIPLVVIIGSNEDEAKTAIIKDMRTGIQKKVSQEILVSSINKLL